MDNLLARLGQLISPIVRGFISRMRSERGEVVIPFIDSVDEAQKPAVQGFVTNSGATTEDLASFNSFDDFLTGYKPKVQADWTSGLDAEQKSKLGIKGWKTPGDAIKGYSELEKLVGHDKIAMPKKDAYGNYEKGELERVMTQLGMPKEAKDYKTSPDFKLPDGVPANDKFVENFKVMAHKVGLLPHQFSTIMNGFAEMTKHGMDAQSEANKLAFNESMLNLRSKWGLAYDSKAKLANSVLATYLKDNPKAADIAKKYGNDPALIELLANVGGDLSEESLSRNNMSGTVLDPTAARMEIDKIRAERSKELLDPNHPQHKYYVDKLDELYKML